MPDFQTRLLDPVKSEPYDPTNYAEVRNRIFANTKAAFSQRFPLENERYVLGVEGLEYEDKVPTLRDEKMANLKNGNVTRKLRGNWVLTDKETGEEKRSQQRIMMNVPYLTRRGTFIRNGSEKAIGYMFRLAPGVYARKKDNGMFEAHVNPKQGTGGQFKIELDPKSGIMRLRKGTRGYKLYPLLKRAGVTDDQIKKSWGQEMLAVNKQASDIPSPARHFSGGVSKTAADYASHYDELLEQLQKSELDPVATEFTLGRAHKKVTPETLLESSAKVLALSRGETEADYRDGLEFQKVDGPADYFAERIVRDGGGLARNLLWRVSRNGSFDDIPPAPLNKHVDAIFNESKHAAYIDGSSPFSAIDLSTKITRIGEGGIASGRTAPPETRAVQDSFAGFIDPVRSVECYDDLTEVMTEQGWKFFKDITHADKLACLVNDRLEYHAPEKLHEYEYTGPLYTAKSSYVEYAVTPEHRMYVRPQSHSKKNYHPEYKFEYAKDVAHKSRLVKCGGHTPIEGVISSFILPIVEPEPCDVQQPRYVKNVTDQIDIGDWCEFLGWYLSEGSYELRPGISKGVVSYKVNISQVREANKDNYENIRQLLSRLPFSFSEITGERGFSMCTKQLAVYVSQFGKSSDKYIPQEVFDAPVEARERFVEAAMAGDGGIDVYSGEKHTYHTASRRLAEDMQRLLFGLGWSTRITWRDDDREERYLRMYRVRRHKVNERLITHRSIKNYEDGMYLTVPYKGKVYCATVPGGVMYVRRNNSYGIWCGNSTRVGLDMYLNQGVRKGDDGRLYTKMIEAKTGKERWVDSLTAARSKVATSREMKSDSRHVPAFRGSKGIGIVPKKDVDFYIPDDSNMYSLGANSVPGKNGIMANRLHMGGKYGTQSMPLAHREAPLFRSKHGKGSVEEILGGMFGVNKASDGGRVAKVDANKIVIRGLKGEQTYDLYDNHPFNQKGYLRSIPQVKVGDEITPGQVLSTSNYTDDKGVAAQGRNLRVAYMPWKGMNFEDAIAISETAAKKMSAEKMYKNRIPVSSNTEFDKASFMGKFSGKFTEEQMKPIGKNGVIKRGTVVREGDPLIVAVRQNDAKPGSMGRKTKTALSQTWDHKYEGKVVDVDIGEKQATVYVRANIPMKNSDKMSNRYAAKGVVNVVPDNQMPLDKDGNPVDVVANSLGIIGRVNPMQVVEAMAGKLARHTGKPEVVEGFGDKDLIKHYEQKLKENGLSATESMYDPQTGREIPDVMVGDAFFYRLMHMGEDKAGARGIGGVTAEETPLRGGAAGAKQMGGLHTSAVVSHGAMKVLKDAKLIRGQANDDFWRSYRMGKPVRMPGKSLVNEKFYDHLLAAGINVEENADRSNFFGMTNEQARKLSKGHELEMARTFDQKTMKAIKGGLFDPKLFGANGDDWAYIQLDEPMPNPVMERSLANILRMTQKNFNEVMNGEDSLNGLTGGFAIKAALEKMDMKSEVKSALQELKNSKPSKKDKALKRYRALKSMEEQDVEPKDFMMERVPVLPPKFRPVTQLEGTNITADANMMYRSLMFARDDLRSAKERLPGDMLKSARGKVYKSYKALSGLYDPDDAKLEDKNVQGLLKWVFGKGSAKRGAYQRRILGTSMNIVGRGVVTPNPALKLDEMGIPIKQAWDVYEPFVVRDMVRHGYAPTAAIRMVKEQDHKALKHLQDVVKERPVIVNRAPSLHKYSVMAFNTKLVKGNTVQVPASIVGPYGMDFDGDTVTYYVPVSKEAVDEAREKMMPTKNLLSARSFQANYTPSQEFVQGLYLATRAKKEKPKKTFRTAKEAQAAFNKGEIDIDTPIVIVEN